jgi:dienelactone hydrolase
LKARALNRSSARTRADVEIYRYPGAGHHFTDPELSDRDAASTAPAWKVALGFFATLWSREGRRVNVRRAPRDARPFGRT